MHTAKALLILNQKKQNLYAETLLYITDGVAFHMVDRPNNMESQGIWNVFKKIIIDLLGK